MADMIKFYKGLEASLPASGVNGALYITTDEGAIYLGTGTGMKRLGDFVQVANVAALPEKAHENCLYYCVAENILAKWNGTEWKQVNKQPTTDELKTLLGLGTLAYKSEVAEGDLNADLAAKINAASGAQHSHDNKDVIDGITAEKVAAWDAAEGNAKGYADGLNTAMNTRVEALEAIDHEHANAAELAKIADGDKAKWDAASEKAHTHTFNETELNKIVDGDVAKWNGVAADHLTSADKTTLENAIKEAKKAGTDANTNIETYKVANDARVLAVEEDIAEIVDGTNGILAQAKSYTDGKDSAMNTRVAALETAAPTHATKDELAGVDAKFANYNTTVAQKAIDDAQDAEIAKKVDKVEGKSLILDTEITRLAGMSTGANKVEASANNGSIKIDGVETVVYTHPEKHAISDVTGLQDALDGKQAAGNYSEVGHKHVKADITDFAHTHVASEITDLDSTIKGYDYATKTELGNVDKKFENYKTAEAQKAIDDEQDRRLGVIEGDYLKAADIANFETKENVKKVADDLAAYVTSNNEALAGVKATADAAAVKTEVNAALALKADKSVVDAMYTNAQIDGFIDDAKKYADDNDANTTYTLGYESKVDGEGGHPARIVLTPSEGEAQYIDATPFIKDGMLDNVAYNEATNTLTFTFNTDAGKEAVTVELTDILAPYTGSTGDRVKVEVTDGVISADLIAGSISKDYLDEGVKASLALADSALQSHQDISHLATKEELNAAKTESANQDAVILSEAQKYADAAQDGAEAKAAELDAALKTELQGEIDADVKVVSDALAQYKTDNNAAVALKANAADVYTKDEVDAAVAAAVETAQTWGEF